MSDFSKRELGILEDALWQAILRTDESLEMGYLPQKEHDELIVEKNNYEWMMEKVSAHRNNKGELL